MRHSTLLVLSALAASAAPIDRMKSQALLIDVQHVANGKKSGGTGSGFPIDARHIVTNFHVCCNAPQGADTDIIVAAGAKDIYKVVKAHAFANKDLGVLELEKPLNIPPVNLVAHQFLKEGEDIWAVGFPGASMRVGDEAAAFVPSISKGIVSKFLSSPPRVKDGQPVGHIQMTTAVNSGNSGGPLFDGCGRVVGIVVAKALTSLGGGKTFAEGVNLAIMVDELLPELDKLKLPYTPAEGACEAGPAASGSGLSFVQIATLLTAAAALFIAMNKRTRTAITQATHRLTQAPPVAPKRMVLVGVAGTYAGQKIPLSSRPVVLGRDPSIANLVFPTAAEHVSKRHCQVTCDGSGRVVLEDSWSSNGTFMAAGERLSAGKPRELRAGDRFYLGSQTNLFEVAGE
jgi:hypothetical protein